MDYKPIQNRLKAVRKRLGLTQEDCARELGISRSAYTYYERGDVQIGVVDLMRLARFFGVKTTELTGETDGRQSPEWQERLIQRMQQLDPAGRETVLRFLNAALETQEQHIERGDGESNPTPRARTTRALPDQRAGLEADARAHSA